MWEWVKRCAATPRNVRRIREYEAGDLSADPRVLADRGEEGGRRGKKERTE